jgi:2-methylisocitrate lyase-like PEP mutase family enzyme
VPEAERVAEAVRRGGLYLGAGADCIYPIGVSDEKDIAALVASVPGPINANTRSFGWRNLDQKTRRMRARSAVRRGSAY